MSRKQSTGKISGSTAPLVRTRRFRLKYTNKIYTRKNRALGCRSTVYLMQFRTIFTIRRRGSVSPAQSVVARSAPARNRISRATRRFRQRLNRIRRKYDPPIDKKPSSDEMTLFKYYSEQDVPDFIVVSELRCSEAKE